MTSPPRKANVNVLDVVDALRDLNPSERQSRLDEMGLPPALRRQVERCLRALPRTGEFLERPPLLVSEVLSGTTSAIRGRPLLGTRGAPFGEYRLIEHLASGTFGEVWVAAHHSLDAPGAVPTCLKLLYPDRSDLEDVLREARTMAAIRHENVVSVRRADRVAIGERTIPFIEMELVGEISTAGRFEPARSLAAAAVNDGVPKLTPDQAMSIVAGICRGVHAAHLGGTLHRDLKPANILLEPRSLRAKVTDFGIASHSGSSAATGGTARGLGTPAYMAPEQTHGKTTQASDVYAMGAILYFLFAGHAPYDVTADRATPDAWRQILDQLERGDPPRPLPVRQRRIPSAAAAIVAEAMAHDPADRYTSAAAMADDLDACRARRPTLAAKPGPFGRLRLWARRNPLVAGLVLAIVLGCTAGPAIYVHGLRQEQARTESQRQAAVAAQQAAVANEHAANAQRLRAERQAAEGLVLQADALALAGRWLEARSVYRDAAASLSRLKMSTFPADSGLWAAEQAALAPLLEWPASDGATQAIAFSPDGRRLATGHGAKLRLWDPMTGRLLQERQGHDGIISALDFSPGDTVLASGGRDGTVRLWAHNAEEPPKMLPGHDKGVRAVAFSPDGTVLASGDGAALRLWDARAGTLIARVPMKGGVSCIRFFPGGRRLAAVAGKVRVIDVESRGELKAVPTRGSIIALSADGSRLLAEADEGRNLVVWDTTDWRVVRTLPGHSGHQLSAMTFVGERSDRALTTAWDKAARVWDLSSGKQIREIAAHEGWVLSAALAADGRRLVTSGFDRVAPMRLWDIQPQPPRFNGEARDLSADGRCLLLQAADDLLHVVDVATGQDLRILADSNRTYGRTVFHDGSSQVIAQDFGGHSFRQWDVTANKIVHASQNQRRLTTSPDGRAFLESVKGVLVLREHPSGREVWRTSAQDDPELARFSDDGRLLVTWREYAGTGVSIRDATTGQHLRRVAAEKQRIQDVALSRDGRYLLIAHGADNFHLWETPSGTLLRTFATNGRPATHLAIAPDGSWLASGSEEGTMQLWDVATGREIRTIPASWHAHFMKVSADGSRLLANGTPMTFCDFGRPARERVLSERVRQAREHLARDGQHAAALAALGEWYAFRHCDDWAIELLERAKAGGARTSSLELARAYWRLGRGKEAAREFINARTHSEGPADYLSLCAKAAGSTRND